MPTPSRIAALLSTAALGLAACGGDAGGSSPVAPETSAPACTAAASVNLGVGETAVLSAAQAACFNLAAGSGAEYALAGYDARALEAARGGSPAGTLSDPAYTIADATYGGAARSLSTGGASPAAAALPAHITRNTAVADASDDSPFARSTPWVQGERFSVAPIEGTGPVTARVVRVVGGRFALAVIEKDEAGTQQVLEEAGAALEFLAQRGVPLLQSTFSAGVPTTSAGSGQLLILATAWDPAKGAAATWSREDAQGAYSFVWFNMNLRGGKGQGFEMYDHASYRVKVLGHELTHAWQAAWLHGERGVAPADAGWAVEGGADFVAMDLVRRYLNVGQASNWRWSDNLEPGRESVVFALEPFGAQGRVTWGYYDASSLLRDLQARLVAAGMTPEAAMTEVSRGAAEGWYGGDGEGGRAGLVERMRARLGAGWDPAGAVLLWTATQAADDRTSNPALNNPTYYQVGEGSAQYGWKAAGEVRAGSGQSTAVSQVAGGSFYVRLRGASAAGVVSATSTSSDARWMIARVR
ncbi:hypothetical protein [Longimicrobium sp.]|uniref:hypothetical protein n=1 Tax=Longimicrobium sp. TaxID=2029185 RepID=UPI002E358F22|nr:hypothetical protein [Longimicrobium sp.]HEX6038574.1 hypothetical protein [Longimicrobium sp.]